MTGNNADGVCSNEVIEELTEIIERKRPRTKGDLQALTAAVASHFTRLQAKIKVKEEENEKLERKVKLMEENLRQLENERNDLKKRRERFKKEIEDLKQDKNIFRKNVERIEKELVQTKKMMENERKAFQKKEDEYENKIKQLKEKNPSFVSNDCFDSNRKPQGNNGLNGQPTLVPHNPMRTLDLRENDSNFDQATKETTFSGRKFTNCNVPVEAKRKFVRSYSPEGSVKSVDSNLQTVSIKRDNQSMAYQEPCSKTLKIVLERLSQEEISKWCGLNKSKEISGGENSASENFPEPGPSKNLCVTSPIRTDLDNRKRKRKRSLLRLNLRPVPETGDVSLDVLPALNASKTIRQRLESSPEVVENIPVGFSSETSPKHGEIGGNEIPLVCVYCQPRQTFTDSKEWIDHHKLNHPQIEFQFAHCSTCREFFSVELIRIHVCKTAIRQWLESSPEVVENSETGGFSSETGPMHGEIGGNESCDGHTLTTLTMARKEVKGKSSRSSDNWKFICEVCSSKFEHLSEVKDHLIRKHGVESPYPEYTEGCSLCGSMFRTNSDMAAHRNDCMYYSDTLEKEMERK